MGKPYRSRGHHLALRARPQMCEYVTIADRIAAEVDGPVLDWGCGVGQVTDLLRRRGVEVTPFDYRPALPGNGLHPLEAFPDIEAHMSPDPVRLPFGDGAFAAVLSLGVLEHVERPDDSLEELRRVLRPGGTFYLYKLPNRLSWLEWVARRLGLYHHGAEEHERLYDAGGARRLVETHGFTIQELRRANMLPLTLTWPGRRTARVLWALNRVLARVPGLNLLATNLELIATRS
jgi:SAM-dependent methyltransferase